MKKCSVFSANISRRGNFLFYNLKKKKAILKHFKCQAGKKKMKCQNLAAFTYEWKQKTI